MGSHFFDIKKNFEQFYGGNSFVKRKGGPMEGVCDKNLLEEETKRKILGKTCLAFFKLLTKFCLILECVSKTSNLISE